MKFLDFFFSIYKNRQVLISLIKRDFSTQYVGSVLGLLWSFFQPLAFAAIIWFVFSKGLKAMPLNDVPFVVYLLTGMISWNFFAESLQKGTNSLVEYSFLIKKVQFRISHIPLIKIGSSLCVHLVFLLILIMILLIHGYTPTLFWLQSFFFLLATILLATGLTWILSAINVFFKDTLQAVIILMQVGVWASPVFWHYSLFPEEIQFYLQLNPVAYIVDGYRNSFIYGIPFWQQPNSLVFWTFTILTNTVGSYIFIRLRPHYADIL